MGRVREDVAEVVVDTGDPPTFWRQRSNTLQQYYPCGEGIRLMGMDNTF
jgi:hypothetical protein